MSKYLFFWKGKSKQLTIQSLDLLENPPVTAE